MKQEKIISIQTDAAPKAVGPYSQAVQCHDMLYLSGQIGLDPNTGTLVEGGIKAQAEQVMHNLTAVLNAAKASLTDIVKVNIYLTNMSDFPVLNEMYAAWLDEHRPARATVAVAELPLHAVVEMDIIAHTSS